MQSPTEFLDSKDLSKKPFFNFTFLKHNAKNQLIKKIFDKIKGVSQLKLQEWKQLGREKGGYNYIDANQVSFNFDLTQSVIDFIETHTKETLNVPPKKYIYFRVGDVERMYGLLIKNYFIAIYLDCNKEVQNK